MVERPLIEERGFPSCVFVTGAISIPSPRQQLAARSSEQLTIERVLATWTHRDTVYVPHSVMHKPGILQQCCQRRHRPACVTVTVLGFLIAAILLAFVAFGQEEPPHSTLRLVSVVSDCQSFN